METLNLVIGNTYNYKPMFGRPIMVIYKGIDTGKYSFDRKNKPGYGWRLAEHQLGVIS